MKFRNLRVDEIDVRIQSVKANGLSLLLYKDARCDMNILDETVGEMNWQRKHLRDNQNCIVSIWDETKKQWIEKEDTGTESMTEKEKGLASDSFKRACFNWGIGRELYTSPFIWISAEWCDIKQSNGKFVCYDKFEVSEIKIVDGKIVKLKIINSKTQELVFGGNKTSPTPSKQTTTVKPTTSTTDKKCKQCGSVVTYKEGTNKDGKKWAGYFCSNKDHTPEWVKVDQPVQDFPTKVLDDEITDKVMDEISEMPF